MPAQITGDVLRITFEDNDVTWKTAFPLIYTQQDVGTPPWYVNDTFPYNDDSTYRSGGISHGGTVKSQITFTLTSAGQVKFNYCISSESGCDWLRIYLDNVQIVATAGEVAWTDFTSNALAVGEHTIVFQYSKDGSVSRNKDACAIGYIEITGIQPPFDTWYLLQDQTTSKWYKNSGGVFEEVSIAGTEPTLQEFRDYGGEVFPDALLETLYHFKVFKCSDTEDYQELCPTLKATMSANRAPVLLKLSPAVRMTQPYQTGFNTVHIETQHLETTEVRYIISYDNTHWYAYNGTSWDAVNYTPEDVLSQGMSEETLDALTAAEFELLYDGTIPFVMYIALVFAPTVLDDWHLKGGEITYTTNL